MYSESVVVAMIGCVVSCSTQKCFVDVAVRAKGAKNLGYVCEDFIGQKWTGCCLCL